jgi:transcriptional regulator with XRE-family HTH domain
MSIDTSVNKNNTNDARRTLKLISIVLSHSSIFADVLNLYLSKSNVSPSALAHYISVDPSAVAHWRKGRRLPTDAGVIFAIAKALDLKPNQRKQVILAWQVQKTLLNLVPYIEEALRIADDDDMEPVLSEVEQMLDGAKHTLDQFTQE